jgi:D-alanyl-lipoteichoic acid acyltransferase DltB (MBOAT superfamily)
MVPVARWKAAYFPAYSAPRREGNHCPHSSLSAMLFNSLEFLVYFPVVVLVYFWLPFRYRWAWLLAASCLFYMAFIPVYILILFFTIIIDYYAGLYIERARGKDRKRLLAVSIIANVGVLAVFKYYNFLNDNLNFLFTGFALENPVPYLNIILPIGLSFHTFQAMSYTIEVYRGTQPAERHLGYYSLYVMYFPQLVAGPIERPQNVLPQFHQPHDLDYCRTLDGLKRMTWGMFKKVVVADNLAVMVNNVYNHPTDYQGVSLLIATVFFAFQIYCDFSGYSDIAIGASHIMGIRLMENFNRPYYAKSIGEFWRRWHISLSTWFRDYLYIPLGGNRVSVPRQYFNLFFIFMVSGIWHGANWTFVIWGALHGFYQIFGRLTKTYRDAFNARTGLTRLPGLLKLLRVGSTFLLVAFAWIFFRANSVTDAFYIVENLFTGLGNWREAFGSQREHVLFLDAPPRIFFIGLLSVGPMEAVHLVQRHGSVTEALARKPVWVRWPVYYGAVLLILLLGNFGSSQFIYFQF